MDEASHGCQQEDKRKLFPLCKKEASMSQSEPYVLSEYGCSHAWMFPGTLKTGNNKRNAQGSGIPKEICARGNNHVSARKFETL